MLIPDTVPKHSTITIEVAKTYSIRGITEICRVTSRPSSRKMP